MQCPKCKNEIEDNALRCSHCGAKVASICKSCGTINPITSIECSGCHKVLIKICSDCGAANLPDAKVCRKCGIEFVKPKVAPEPVYTANTNSQQKVKAKLLEAIKDADSTIITISGESGIGKNLVLRYTINELKNAKLIWLLGTCTQVTQLSPFGYFQDLLLNFFNINNFCPDTLQLKKNSIKFFKQDFPSLSNQEILDLLNFLYPENLDIYENIYKNKAKTFLMMKKVILTIVEKMKVVFIVDNFENIDGMSFDFLQELLKDEYILERCKFILISSITRPGLGCITSPLLTENNYTDLTIAPFTKNQVDILTHQYNDVNAGEDFINLACKVSSGNPAVIEQMILLHKDITKKKLKHIQYNSLESIIETRLSLLKQEDYSAYRILIAMTILGCKFYPAVLEHFDNNPPEEFERIIETLVQKGFVQQINNLSFEFKSYSVWKAIAAIIKNEDILSEILNILYEILSMYKQSSLALLGYVVQKLNNSQQAFQIWTLLMKQAAYIGDIGLYIIAQKQSLKLVENKTDVSSQKIKRNIYTRVGKLLEPIDFETSFTYLQNAIMLLDDNAEYEHIELLGYLASCSMKKGNYWGVIECADSVLNKVPEEMELERTLVKSRQTRPLLKLGNYGQTINLIDTEIRPCIERYISRNKNTPVINMQDLFETWLELYFDLAEALTFQGDCRMFEIIKVIFDIIERNQIAEPAVLCRVHLALALANTIKGDLNTSEKILDDILKEYSLDTMDSFIVSRWNFIDILNKFTKKDYNSLYTELFNVVAYANNVNDNFTKNILKTLLAKMFKDKNENKKALEILEEQVAYFAKEKIATGVLLAWYLIAETRLITNGTQFALDIATKALDIAQGPNINNYYFIALYNKLIGEIYMAKQDFDSAKVYLEKSIFIAKQFNLEAVLIKGYLLYAKLYQELALPKSTLRSNYIKQALKMFQLAKNVSIAATHTYLQKNIKEELTILSSFCKLNGIIIKKGTK